MRIISGIYRSRRLLSPADKETRPITDRVKESLFNHLREQFENANVVDLFSGTGSLGLEALSQGAAHVLFVEQNRESAQRLKQNIETLGVEDQTAVVVGDALSSACLTRAERPVRIAFVDPPYVMMYGERARVIFDQMARLAGMMDPEGFIILRTSWPAYDNIVHSLTSEFLEGPETIEYKTMALHFYQVRDGV